MYLLGMTNKFPEMYLLFFNFSTISKTVIHSGIVIFLYINSLLLSVLITLYKEIFL